PPVPVLARRGSGRQRGRGRAGRLSDPPDIRPTEAAGRQVGGRTVLLVDDVMTTGATLSTAAGALLLAGAGSVSALTFTRRL
ncbi:MAG TPA: phosphoribosyltransferase family protein, partial [Solirubrobacterales bacterium]|nr:phosphoribosyltransferase family protein [Solirubrobacterales bacterium]